MSWDDNEPWIENDGFAQTLVDKANFLDILDKYKLEYQRTGSSNSSHKLRCPFPSHLNGEERTPSLHISINDNVFKCFGCNAGGTIIDFVMMLRGMPRYKAMEEIAKITGLTEGDIDENYTPTRRDPEQEVLTYVYRSNIAIREYLATLRGTDQYDKWQKLVHKWFKRLDHFMLELEDDQWEIAKNYYERIIEFIEIHGHDQ